MFKSRLFPILVAAVVFVAGESSPLAAPPLLNLSSTPLFLNATVDPNVFVTFDDSGSMSLGSVPDTVNDPACYWRRPNYYSSSYNGVYYNPNITYTPPIDQNGVSLGNQSFTAAETNGFAVGGPTVNLGTQYFVTDDENNDQATTPSPTRISYLATATVFDPDPDHNPGTPEPACPSTSRRFAFPSGSAAAFYYNYTGPATRTAAEVQDPANYTAVTVGAAEQQNFANWFSYYRYRSIALKSAVGRSFGVLDDNIRVQIQNMNSNAIASGTTIGKFSGTNRSNFFNVLTKTPQAGNTPTLVSALRVDSFFRRAGGAVTTNPYYDSDYGRELSCRQNFHVLVTDGFWNQNPSHPTTAAGYIDAGHTLPDGKTYATNDPYSQFIWNGNGRGNNCNTGTRVCSPSHTDIGLYGWSQDLRTDLTNNVPPYIPDRTTGVTGPVVDLSSVSNILNVPEIYWNPANDPATWQHLDQFFVGFGTFSATLPFTPAEVIDLRTGVDRWTPPRNNDPNGVDDSWRSSLASRGKTFLASDPETIVDGLTDVLASIVARKGTASAISVSTGIVTGSSLTFQTQFDSTDASGTVLGRTVDSTFTFNPRPTWDANCNITGGACATNPLTQTATPNWDTGRQFLTSRSNGAGAGVAFRFGSLSAAQQALLNKNPQTGATDSLGGDRLNYVRGERRLERQSGGTFRNRAALFGAVVNSAAVFVGTPRERFDVATGLTVAEQTSYKTFKDTTWANRAPMVLVGANDGTMHVLDGNTGAEYWAYVPFGVYKNLTKLTDPLYQFENYVDSSPVVRDVYFGGAWHTVAVGTLRKGGQGLFAVDITNPNVTESNASAKVLWDLTDGSTGMTDLGYTYGLPFITRLSNGKFVALVPGAYNSQEPDTATGSGTSVMFVLDIANGSVIKKFDIATVTGGDPTSQGLTTPIAIDIEADEVSNMFYAGDLNGNIWRFDVQNPDPNFWTVAKLFTPTTAFANPITAAPRALLDPAFEVPMVFVGTGKYIETTDRGTAIPVQSFYGIRDFGTTVTTTDLGSRSITTSSGLRTVSGASTNAGWRINLNDSAFPGERVVAPASLRVSANEVIFATLIPNGNDPCLPGGQSFLMFADASTGGKANDGFAFFDVNGDQKIDTADNANVQGKLVGSLVPGVASILQQGGGVGGIVLPPADVGGTPDTIRTREFEWRRRSWRERFRHGN